MICDNCLKINQVASCSSEWEVGQVNSSHNGDDLNYQLTNLATGYVSRGETETVSTGDVVIVFEDETDLPIHWHKLELFDSDMNPVPVAIGNSEEYCCLEFPVFPMQIETVTFSVTTCQDVIDEL